MSIWSRLVVDVSRNACVLVGRAPRKPQITQSLWWKDTNQPKFITVAASVISLILCFGFAQNLSQLRKTLWVLFIDSSPRQRALTSILCVCHRL